MQKPLLGKKLAVLVANGFNEKDLIETQKGLQPSGVDIRIVSMNHGLVNSWNGEGWGLNFAADKVLNAALSADFSMLVIPGGQRSIEKLQLTAHTARFVNGFLEAGKPVVAMGEAIELLLKGDKMAGRMISGPDARREAAEQAGAVWQESVYTVDDNLMTGDSLPHDECDAYMSAIKDFLATSHTEDKVAA